MTCKYELIHTEEGNYPVTVMCDLLGIERTGYYAWQASRSTPPPAESRAARRELLAERIEALWKASRRAHGARRLQVDLREEGHQVSLWLIGTIMGELGIAGIQPHGFKRTTIPSDDADTRVDLLRRRFQPPVPTTHLVGDITYLKTEQGWLYLATVIDLTTRMVVGWQTADHMRTSLIVDALADAHRRGYVAGGAVFHSDRGAQYTSIEFATAARRLDVRLSVGRTGVCWDNAVAESFFSMLKNEMYHHQRFSTRARAHLAVADYIEVFYNRRRRHSTIDYRTPAQVMNDFFTRTDSATNQAA